MIQSPDEVNVTADEARATVKAMGAEGDVARIVADAPPLSDETLDRVAAVLRSALRRQAEDRARAADDTPLSST